MVLKSGDHCLIICVIMYMKGWSLLIRIYIDREDVEGSIFACENRKVMCKRVILAHMTVFKFKICLRIVLKSRGFLEIFFRKNLIFLA